MLDAGYRKAWSVARDVAKAYCKRAMKSLDRDNAAEAAWRDLLAAEAMNTGEKCVADCVSKLRGQANPPVLSLRSPADGKDAQLGEKLEEFCSTLR